MSFFIRSDALHFHRMGKDSWVRARTPDQIETRTREIRDATRRLLEDYRYEDISLVMIATESSFTRSNIYRYYATKEEVFLDILKEDLTEWVHNLRSWLDAGGMTVPEFAARWIDSLLEHRLMLRLLSVLGTTLEAGSSVDALAVFKRQISVIHRSEIQSLRSAFPALTVRNAHSLILLRSCLVVGAFPAMQPTQKQIDAMAISNVPFEPEAYRDTMVAGVEAYLESMIRQS